MKLPQIKKPWLIAGCIVLVFIQASAQNNTPISASYIAKKYGLTKQVYISKVDSPAIIKKHTAVPEIATETPSGETNYRMLAGYLLALGIVGYLAINRIIKQNKKEDVIHIKRSYAPYKIVALIFLSFWILNPGLTQFKEHTGDTNVTKKCNFLLFSVYEDDSDTYVGVFLNFFQIS